MPFVDLTHPANQGEFCGSLSNLPAPAQASRWVHGDGAAASLAQLSALGTCINELAKALRGVGLGVWRRRQERRARRACAMECGRDGGERTLQLAVEAQSRQDSETFLRQVRSSDVFANLCLLVRLIDKTVPSKDGNIERALTPGI